MSFGVWSLGLKHHQCNELWSLGFGVKASSCNELWSLGFGVEAHHVMSFGIFLYLAATSYVYIKNNLIGKYQAL